MAVAMVSGSRGLTLLGDIRGRGLRLGTGFGFDRRIGGFVRLCGCGRCGGRGQGGKRRLGSKTVVEVVSEIVIEANRTPVVIRLGRGRRDCDLGFVPIALGSVFLARAAPAATPATSPRIPLGSIFLRLALALLFFLGACFLGHVRIGMDFAQPSQLDLDRGPGIDRGDLELFLMDPGARADFDLPPE